MEGPRFEDWAWGALPEAAITFAPCADGGWEEPAGADDIARARGGAGACGIGPGNGFLPMTMVLLANGTRVPIEEVETGDFALAYDRETGEADARPVLDLIEGHGWKDLVEITIDGATVTATAGHPFWVEGIDR